MNIMCRVYEFVYYDEYENSINEKLMQVLSAIRFSVIDKDEDHMKKLDEPILVPSLLIYAHELSKSMGDELVKNWIARTWNEFLRLKEKQFLVSYCAMNNNSSFDLSLRTY